MSQPKILLWDLETSLNIVTAFQLFNKNAPLHHAGILQERSIICASFKELGKAKVTSVSVLDDMKRFKKDPSDDLYVVKAIHKILNGADAVIAHNGNRFDTKYFNTRAVFHNLPPIAEPIQIDTLVMAKSKFSFNNNRLDYLGQFFKVGKKISTDYSLWMGCLQGKVTSVREMIKYNQEDVRLLERVYLKLAPYCANKYNFNIENESACPTCGDENLIKFGFYRTAVSLFQRFRCTSCHSTCRGKIIPKETKRTVLR